MFRKLFSIIILCAICSAVPVFNLHSMQDRSELENIRVKRYGYLGGYNSYMNDSPYTYKFKNPFFKVKIKNGNQNGFYGNQSGLYGNHGGFFGNQGGFMGHPPYGGFGGVGGSYPPYGAGVFHPPVHTPYGGYHYNPHGYGYGWFG